MNLTKSMLLQSLLYSLESLIYWRIISGALKVKYRRIHYILAAGGLFLLMAAKGLVSNLLGFRGFLALGSIIILGYVTITFFLMCKNKPFVKLIWLVIYTLGSAIMEIVPVLVFKMIAERPLNEMVSSNTGIIISLICKFFELLLIEVIIRRFQGYILIGSVYFRELIIIITWNLLLQVSTVYFYESMIYRQVHADDVVYFIFNIVFIITIYNIFLIFRLEKKAKEELETQLKLKQIEMELKLNNDMIFMTDKLRKLRHDMNNHMGLMKALVQMEKYDELENYINQIYEDVELANELVITGNKTLSVLLNSKRNLAKGKNIAFFSMITIDELNMQSKDICALFGNMLDNAIESAEKSMENKYIDFMIQKNMGTIVISCENSLGVKPVIKNDRFLSAKGNKQMHGIGTSIMKDVVHKYNGSISFHYDNEMFQVKVVLPV